MGFYKNRREYLVAAIREQQLIIDNERAHEGVKQQSRRIHARLCGELDDLDAARQQLIESALDKLAMTTLDAVATDVLERG